MEKLSYETHNQNSCHIPEKNSNSNGRIKIVGHGLINMITLLDFPDGQYTLSFNGIDSGIAERNSSNHHQEFKIYDSNSELLDILKESSVGIDEPKINDRKNYVNLHRIQNTLIKFPKNIKLKEKHIIKLHGYFKTNCFWSKGIKYLDVYPDYQ